MADNTVLEFLDFLQDVENVEERQTRPRITRQRPNWFHNFDEIDFFKRYRITKSTSIYILEDIDHDLEFSSDRNCSVSPINQLLIALRFYATGSHLLAIGDMHGVDVSTVSRVVQRVSVALVCLRDRYIKMPSTNEEIQRSQREFYSIANFPNVIGAIDCTHVKIQSPGGNDAELFRNRKGYFSIYCQTICDANLKIRNIVARWPGSTHDSAIFTNSRVCHEFESNNYGSGCLLGVSGYPLKSYLLTPYLNPRTDAQELYNKSQIKTRNTVERQYGVLKRRFPALAIGLGIKLETAINVIIACGILHNICIEFGESLPPNEFDDEYLHNLIQSGQFSQANLQEEVTRNAVDKRDLPHRTTLFKLNKLVLVCNEHFIYIAFIIISVMKADIARCSGPALYY